MRKVRHIPLGPDDDLPEAPARDEARRRLGLEGPLLLTVGSILNRRRVMELLAAVRRLIAGHPKLRLEIVGDNRTTPRIDLDALIAEWHLTEHVRLSGFVSETELACRYAAADLAIFLSEYEGFGLPALEAMSRNVPVIVANRPSLSEVFHSAALLVEPDDVTSIAAGIDGLLRSVALRQALVARGRLLAARYSWAQTAALTLETLEEAAAQ
jgi:glycosyltransferase involved in cell wall biosynthesis